MTASCIPYRKLPSLENELRVFMDFIRSMESVVINQTAKGDNTTKGFGDAKDEGQQETVGERDGEVFRIVIPRGDPLAGQICEISRVQREIRPVCPQGQAGLQGRKVRRIHATVGRLLERMV